MPLDSVPLQPVSPATEHAPIRLLSDLPAEWRGDVIGPGIDTWERATDAGSSTPLRLNGLPARIRTELAWMAHWQFREGNKVNASEYNQFAQMLRQGIAGSKLRIDSLLDVDLKVFVPLYRGWFESRYGRLPSPGRHDVYAPRFLWISQIGAGGTDERRSVVDRRRVDSAVRSRGYRCGTESRGARRTAAQVKRRSPGCETSSNGI